jgi:hypothetical protein
MPTNNYTYKDRFNLLRSKIARLSNDERDYVKNNLKQITDTAASEAYRRMVQLTPVRPDEDADMYKAREDAIGRYGKPSYIKTMSPNRSVRLYGSNLRDGWQLPKVDFIGSNLGTIRLSASISNIAEHAKMVIEGNYREKIWNITGNPLQGGRKALAWMRGSKPFFVRPENFNFPVKFKSNTKVKDLDIPGEGRKVIDSYKDRMMSSIKQSMIDESRVIFR